MKLTYRDIAWFAVVALIVVWLSKCHRDRAGDLQSQANEIIKASQEKDLAHAKQTQILSEKLAASEAAAQQLANKAEKAGSQLQVTLKTIARLSAAVNSAKDIPYDTSFVTVSPDYVTYCDSLAINSENIAGEYEGFKISIGDLVTAKDSVINALKETVNHERTFSAECKREFGALGQIYKDQIQSTKPRSQIYVGAELIGNQQTLIQNVGAVLSLKTKGNKLWQISSGLQNNGQVYGRISGSILITFKK